MEFKPFSGDTDLRSPRKKMATGKKARLGKNAPAMMRKVAAKSF